MDAKRMWWEKGASRQKACSAAAALERGASPQSAARSGSGPLGDSDLGKGSGRIVEQCKSLLPLSSPATSAHPPHF